MTADIIWRSATFKQLLLLRYCLTAAEKVHKLLSLADFSYRTAVNVMEAKLLLLGSGEGAFLFRDILLLLVHGALANSPCLAKEAFQVLLTSRLLSDQNVASDTLHLTEEDVDLGTTFLPIN